MTMTSSSDKIEMSSDHKNDPIDTFVVYTKNADQYNTGELVRYSFYEAQKRVSRNVATIKGFVPGTKREGEAMKKIERSKQVVPKKSSKDNKKKKQSVIDKVKGMVTK